MQSFTSMYFAEFPGWKECKLLPFPSTSISLALASDILLTSGWHLLLALGNRSDCDNKLLSFSGRCTPLTCLGILSQLHFTAISVYTVCLLALCLLALCSIVLSSAMWYQRPLSQEPHRSDWLLLSSSCLLFSKTCWNGLSGFFW